MWCTLEFDFFSLLSETINRDYILCKCAPKVKLGPQKHACAGAFVYVVALKLSILTWSLYCCIVLFVGKWRTPRFVLLAHVSSKYSNTSTCQVLFEQTLKTEEKREINKQYIKQWKKSYYLEETAGNNSSKAQLNSYLLTTYLHLAECKPQRAAEEREIWVNMP